MQMTDAEDNERSALLTPLRMPILVMTGTAGPYEGTGVEGFTAGTVRAETFEERLAAASTGDFSYVSITPPPWCAPPLLHGADQSGKERMDDHARRASR